MIPLPITEESKQEEWKAILAIARKNGYPINTINNLKTRLIPKKQKQNLTTISHDKNG